MADAKKGGAQHKQRFEFAGVFAEPDERDAVDADPCGPASTSNRCVGIFRVRCVLGNANLPWKSLEASGIE
eukprot:7956609-Alexandrium_andersonii.AAC.1